MKIIKGTILFLLFILIGLIIFYFINSNIKDNNKNDKPKTEDKLNKKTNKSPNLKEKKCLEKLCIEKININIIDGYGSLTVNILNESKTIKNKSFLKLILKTNIEEIIIPILYENINPSQKFIAYQVITEEKYLDVIDYKIDNYSITELNELNKLIK